MTAPEPPAVSFLDDDGNELPDEVDTTAAAPERRRDGGGERWWPEGGAAALSGLVLVLVAWIGAAPVAQALSALFPEADRTFSPTDGSNFGGGGYFGIAPEVVPIISFGTRAAIVLVALVLGLRARRWERSTLAGACVTTATVSLVLFVGSGVVMFVGIALGHQSNVYGVF